MLRIAICDDEIELCSNLERIVGSYLRSRSIQFEIDVFFSANSTLEHLDKECSYDILFLDIEMQGLSGIEVGKKIRNDYKNDVVKIIYVSWEDSYAMNLFEVRPMDFIIKPFSDDRIHKVLEIAIELVYSEMQFFHFQLNNNHEKVLMHEILYFESINRKIIMYTIHEKHEFYGKLDDLVEKTDGKYFWRIHKSYLINHLHVKRFEYKQVVMANDVLLKISRRQQNTIRDRYLRLLKES